jgi:hypothetical protein
MREKAHVWLVKQAIDWTKNIGSHSELAKLLAAGESDVWLGSFWLPDIVIADRKEGHTYRYTLNTKRVGVREYNCANFLENSRACINYLKENGDLTDLILATPKQGKLPSRCSEIAARIVELVNQWQKEKANLNLKRDLTLTLFMLGHYIADGHMPLHCDLRDTEKNSSLPANAHGIIERVWEELVANGELKRVKTYLHFKCLLEKNNHKARDSLSASKKAAILVKKEMDLATRISFALAQSHFKKASDLELKNLVKITRPIFTDTIQTICYLWLVLWELGVLKNS